MYQIGYRQTFLQPKLTLRPKSYNYPPQKLRENDGLKNLTIWMIFFLLGIQTWQEYIVPKLLHELLYIWLCMFLTISMLCLSIPPSSEHYTKMSFFQQSTNYMTLPYFIINIKRFYAYLKENEYFYFFNIFIFIPRPLTSTGR